MGCTDQAVGDVNVTVARRGVIARGGDGGWTLCCIVSAGSHALGDDASSRNDVCVKSGSGAQCMLSIIAYRHLGIIRTRQRNGLM